MSRPLPSGRADFRAWRTVTLRWADNDAYGHVNNTVYYAWFDTAVNQWLIERGLLDLANGQAIGLVVETSCSYFEALSYPGEVEVGLGVERVGTSSVTYRLGVFAPDAAQASAQGLFTHVYVDRKTRRPAALADAWRSALQELEPQKA